MEASKIVKEWFKYAIRDLKSAQHLSHLGPDYKNQIAFHIQQCVEKSIKGYLAHHKVRFSKTHSIARLADEVSTIDQKLAHQLAKHSKMSRYAVIFRYPDAELTTLKMSEVTSSMKKAQKIYDLLLDRVSQGT